MEIESFHIYLLYLLRCYLLDIPVVNNELFMSGPIDVNMFISVGKL
jgi:hypothetical protein